MTGHVMVLDASALAETLMDGPASEWVAATTRGRAMAAPAHLLSETLSALGRRFRAGELTAAQVAAAIGSLEALRIESHEIGPLLRGAWRRREQLRLADGLYVELAAQLDTVVVTTDRRLARATSLAVAPPADGGT